MITKYDQNNELGIRKSKEIQSGLNYINRIQYGTYISLGLGNYEISYRYRISRIIQEGLNFIDPNRLDYYLMDFPRNTLGLSVRIGL